jgi:hypothetical protein
MEHLQQVIQQCLPAIVAEFNDVRLPLLEQALGRNIIDEFPDPVKRTSETTKVIGRILDNTFFRHIHAIEPDFIQDEGAGRDLQYKTIPIEDKNTFGKGDSWTGNGYDKTGWHLLKKFHVNDSGRICAAFIALVNLDDCESCWSERTLKSNFSSLMLKAVDVDKVLVIVGSLKKNPKNLSPVLVPIEPLQTQETRG